ncbi:MAG: hypothetical protein IPK27_13665 [Rhodanobacteraceae bacterium]|nr:hypothetical protein [Rhodanobacteraceae bacterium]
MDHTESADAAAQPAPAAPVPSRSFLTALFGQWDPPPWCRWLWQRRAKVAGVLVLLAALGYGMYWWATRPAPVIPNALELSLSAPGLTDYDRDDIRVDALRVHFSGSAAPLEAVDGPASGVALEPSLLGSWTWEDDRTLRFQPQTDWPVGQHYTVTLDPKLTVADTVVLAPFDLQFDTAPFTVQSVGSEFYQDPQDANLKKAVWQFRFSHPVDAAKLESALRSRMFDGAGRVLQSPALSTQLNQRKLNAWVHSAPLELPPNGGQVFLDVGKGITSLLGGPGSETELSQKVDLPALYSVTVDDLSPTLVEDPGKDPIQVIVIGFNSAMKDTEVVAATRAWILPEKNPKLKDDEQSIPYQWSEGEIDEALLKASAPLKLTADPAEREWLELHSFKYSAPVGRRIYVRVDKGLKSFGGFILGKPHAVALTVPEYPRLLSFVGEGALLSLRGERRVTVVARNMPKDPPGDRPRGARTVYHLVQFNEGSYGRPELWTIGEDSLVERMEARGAALRRSGEDPVRGHRPRRVLQRRPATACSCCRCARCRLRGRAGARLDHRE